MAKSSTIANQPRIRSFFVRTHDHTSMQNGFGGHVHQAMQWYYCLHGKMIVNIDGTAYLLDGKQGIIISSGKLRSLQFIQKLLQYFTVIFEPNGLHISHSTCQTI